MNRKRTIPVLLVLFIATVLMLPTAVGAASSSRTMPASVEPGAQFTVNMAVADYGSIGSVVETLPSGFTYVGSPLDASQVIVAGNTVTFNLMGESGFEYTVTASSVEDTYAFSGILKNVDKSEVTVGGDTSIAVTTSAQNNGASAVRTLPASVEPGAQFTVNMAVADYGSIGSVVETLPSGFTYVGSPLDASQVIVAGNTVTFNLMGESGFEYTVTASSVEDTYAFSGILKNVDKSEVTVGGDTSIAVGSVADGIILLPGWNFVSVPYELDNSSVDYVLADINYSLPVTYYNAATGLFETVSDLEPLKGYWIKNPEEGTQVILGELLVPKEWAVPATLTVYEGWNAIGYTDPKYILDAETALTSIDESYTTIMGPFKNDPYEPYEQVGWNGQTGVINGIHVGTDVFYMGPYEAFWVLVTQEDMLGAV
jgi:hypothetical protein